jgi:hypothetical protein
MARHSVYLPLPVLSSRRNFLHQASAVVVFWAVLLATPLIAVAETKTFDIVIKDGKVVGAKSVRITQGDTVILRWTSDRPLELHLHGYDVEAEVGLDKPAEMKIDAHATGRFPVEVHSHDKSQGGHNHQALFHLEVYPK